MLKRSKVALGRNLVRKLYLLAKGCVIFLLLTSYSSFVRAHGGGLDSRGGHFDRKTGVYHCHRSSCEQSISNQDRRRICNEGYGKSNCAVPNRQNNTYR